MKAHNYCIILFVVFSFFSLQAQIGINTAQPDQSATLHLESSNKGFLPPRLTEAKMNAMANVAGMLVYCLDCDEKCLYINDGTAFKSMCSLPSSLSVNAANTSVEGLFINGTSFTSDNKFVVTINNLGNTEESINLQIANLVLTGAASAGLTVTGVSPTTANIAANDSQTIAFELSGTPSSTGQITAEFTNGSLNLISTIKVSEGDANITDSEAFVVSIYDAGPPVVDTQGIIDNTTNKITINLPYTNGSGSYDAYVSDYVSSLPNTSETNSANSFRVSYPAGIFSTPTGTIPVTIAVDGDGSFDAKKLTTGNTMLIAELPVQINGNVKSVLKLQIVTQPKDITFGVYSTPDTGSYSPNCNDTTNPYQGDAMRVKLTDGVFDDSGYASQNASAPNYIEIDLKATYTLTGVKVAGGNMSCWGGNLAGYHDADKVQYYNTTTNNWVDLWTVTGTNNTSVTEYTFTAPVKAQRIRIVKDPDGWLSYGEFYPVGYF